MNLYRISQSQNDGYNTFDSAVVVAPDEGAARNMNPRGAPLYFDWDNRYLDWCTAPEFVDVELIGVAADGLHPGVVCASFNAV